MTKPVSISLIALMAVLWISGRAFAGTPVTAPEIDAPTISAGLGLLAAGVLIVRSRRRK